MLTVTQIDYIKHLRENEDASISEIASRLQCDWKTAKKYADGDIDLQELGSLLAHLIAAHSNSVA